MRDVFDRPEAIGEIVWSTGWREPDRVGGRVVVSLIVGLFGLYAFRTVFCTWAIARGWRRSISRPSS